MGFVNDPFYEFIRAVVQEVGSGVLTEQQCKNIRFLWLSGHRPTVEEIVVLYETGDL
jgi:hypothetical protein